MTGLPFGSPPRPKRGPTLFDQLTGVPDEPPADEKPAGTFEEQADSQIGELEAGIKSRKKAERDRFRAATDSEFWFAVCFTSRDEKDRFLRAAGLWEHGDKYLDGAVVAAALDVDMTDGSCDGRDPPAQHHAAGARPDRPRQPRPGRHDPGRP